MSRPRGGLVCVCVHVCEETGEAAIALLIGETVMKRFNRVLKVPRCLDREVRVDREDRVDRMDREDREDRVDREDREDREVRIVSSQFVGFFKLRQYGCKWCAWLGSETPLT